MNLTVAQEPYKYEPHAFKTDRFIAKLVARAICINCGLLRLRNPLTEWCVARGCNYDVHPGLKDACRKLCS